MFTVQYSTIQYSILVRVLKILNNTVLFSLYCIAHNKNGPVLGQKVFRKIINSPNLVQYSISLDKMN